MNLDRRNGGPAGPSPYDTPASAGFRFAIELAAWVIGPWAAAEAAGSVWAALPALFLLVGLPATFNTPGEKQVTGIPTPGPVRILIEAVLLAVAVGGSWLVWPVWAAILITLFGVAMVFTGLPRYRWLAAGAPDVGSD